MIYLTRNKFKVIFYSTIDEERQAVRKSLTFLHPNPWDIPSFREGRWNGLIYKYDMKTFGIGLLHYVVKGIKEAGFKIVWEGFEKPDISWLEFSDKLSAEDRDYQREAIKAIFTNKIGIIKIPTRGGKTYMAGEFIRILSKLAPETNFLFLTDAKDVFDPIRADLGSFSNKTAKEIGEIREQKRNYEKVTVAMIQTLQSALKRKDLGLMKYLKTVDVLIVDEIQEYYSKPRQDLLKRIKKNVKYLVAISASPEKESDFLGWLNIQEIVGNIIYDIHQKELEQRGVLAKNRVLLIINEILPKEIDSNMTYFDIVSHHIHNSDKRNNLLKLLIKACEIVEVKTLVMFSSKKHGYMIAEETEKAFLSGDDDAETRRLVKEAFLRLDGEILLVSEIWKKAITLPEVEVFINADGGKEETAVIQKKGRVLGSTDKKKKALVIDIIDSCSEYFSEHSISRIKVYENSNTGEEIDFMEYDEDLLGNLVQYLKEWFND